MPSNASITITATKSLLKQYTIVLHQEGVASLIKHLSHDIDEVLNEVEG